MKNAHANEINNDALSFLLNSVLPSFIDPSKTPTEFFVAFTRCKPLIAFARKSYNTCLIITCN